MAGIGFELKKLFTRRGMFARLAAIGYAGMITTGPMIMGVVFLALISLVGRVGGLPTEQIEAVLAMTTFAIIASQLVNSVFSTISTRYVSDMLFGQRDDLVVPSLVGVLAIALPLGGALYAILLLASGMDFDLIVLNELLFLELIGVWIEMGYLTAVRDYKGMVGAYALAVVISLAVAVGLCSLGGPTPEKLLGSICVGYGVLMLLDLRLLAMTFSCERGPYFAWLAWADRYPALVVFGVMSCVGLFGHILIGWSNPALPHQSFGIFYSSPGYDVPAFYAALSVIPTAITFVASTEVEFYPVYRRYFDLLNGTGSITQIDAAQSEMLSVMWRELSRLVRRQILSTVIIVAVGTQLLDMEPLNFSTSMNDAFFVLCIGYGAYAVGNVFSTMLMYFSEDRAPARAATIFAVLVVALAALFAVLGLPAASFGWSFAISALLYCVICWRQLKRYVGGLPEAVFLAQPLVVRQYLGRLGRLGERLDGVPASK